MNILARGTFDKNAITPRRLDYVLKEKNQFISRIWQTRLRLKKFIEYFYIN